MFKPDKIKYKLKIILVKGSHILEEDGKKYY